MRGVAELILRFGVSGLSGRNYGSCMVRLGFSDLVNDVTAAADHTEQKAQAKILQIRTANLGILQKFGS